MKYQSSRSSICMPSHWHSSHFAVAHVRNKNSNIQGRSPNVIKSDFPNHKELLLRKELLPLGVNSFL